MIKKEIYIIVIILIILLGSGMKKESGIIAKKEIGFSIIKQDFITMAIQGYDTQVSGVCIDKPMEFGCTRSKTFKEGEKAYIYSVVHYSSPSICNRCHHVLLRESGMDNWAYAEGGGDNLCGSGSECSWWFYTYYYPTCKRSSIELKIADIPGIQKYDLNVISECGNNICQYECGENILCDDCKVVHNQISNQKEVYQKHPHTCGPALIQYIMEREGNIASESDIAKAIGGYDGMKMEEMIKYLRAEGININKIELTMDNIKDAIRKDVPILYLQDYNEDSYANHFSLIIGYGDNYVYVFDPDRGHRGYSYDYFMNITIGKGYEAGSSGGVVYREEEKKPVVKEKEKEEEKEEYSEFGIIVLLGILAFIINKIK